MKLRLRIAILVCLVASGSLFAGTQRLISSDGSRMLTVDQTGIAVYHSGNGTITIELSPTGLKIGEFDVRLEKIAGHRGGKRFHLSVRNHGAARDAEIELANDGALVDSNSIDPFNEEVRKFAHTGDGLLLQEAATLIAEQSARQTSAFSTGDQAVITSDLPQDGFAIAHHERDIDASVHANWSAWACGANVLNGIAGGAAMIGGCATPACGPAIVWCCTSGVAWYGSALIGIGLNCNFYN